MTEDEKKMTAYHEAGHAIVALHEPASDPIHKATIIPLSVPFVWLLFPFSRRYRLYDHTVFVTYSLCFMSLLVVSGLIFGAAGLTGLAGLLWLIPPFHMYRQLKGAYSLGRASTLWRTLLLALFASIVIGLFSAVLVGVGTFD
jgi:hypothetical protein